MFFSKQQLFNPLEQFEINTIFSNYSNFFSNLFSITSNLEQNLPFFNQSNFYNSQNSFISTDLIYFLDVKHKIVLFDSNRIIYEYKANFEMFNPYVIFNYFPASDFFFIYQMLLLLFFYYFYYQHNFFFNSIKFSKKFIFFIIIHLILNLIKTTNKNLIKYSPYLISLFIMILVLNILGLIPFVKSLTSTVSITFFLSMSSFVGLNIEGVLINRLHFFDKFAPSSVPFMILPGLVIIELISYFMRPNSLAIRLFANMLAGHILIKLFVTFCLDLSGVSIVLFFGCFIFICILMTLEVFIAFLQAYIFMFLVLLYLDDILNSQH